MLVDDGHGADDLLHLVVEIKGYRREDAKDKKLTMDTYWVPGVNNLGTLRPLGVRGADRRLPDRGRLRSEGRAGVRSTMIDASAPAVERRRADVAKRMTKHETAEGRRSKSRGASPRRRQAEEHPDGRVPVGDGEGGAGARMAFAIARNRDLDPQLVWRGKDEQDWSDLVVQAPPLYIQEKVHPKVLIDDLLRRVARSAKRRQPASQIDLFADFNGIPEGVDKTEFYQHDQNWTNRMILGDSLQVMAQPRRARGPARQGAVHLHRPAVRHQVQLQLPVVHDQPRREGRQRRRTSRASPSR